MTMSTGNYLKNLMLQYLTVANLKGIDPAAFEANLCNRIDKVDPIIEGYSDPAKQRDMSLRFIWGHNHDFGSFRLEGMMGDRHLNTVAKLIDEQGLPRDLAGKKLLDIGVWTGGTAMLFALMGAEVTAVEEVRKYASTVNYMAGALGLDNLTCISTSLYDLDLHDTFDYVIYSGVIYHVTDPILSLRILFNALKDGGRIFVESYGAMPVGQSESMCLVESGPWAGTYEHLKRAGWNYFVPTAAALDNWMTSVGFADVNVRPLTRAARLHGTGARTRHVDMLRAGLSRPNVR